MLLKINFWGFIYRNGGKQFLSSSQLSSARGNCRSSVQPNWKRFRWCHWGIGKYTSHIVRRQSVFQ